MNWTWNELEHAGAEHLDAQQVAAYDAKAQVDPTLDVERLQALGLSAAHTLMDLGAGTGTLALTAAKVCGRVIAVDISPAMLDFMRAKAARAGVDNLDAVQGGFLSTPMLEGSLNFVYSRNALHHLPDFWKVEALRRVHRALKPGGVMLLRDLAFSFAPEQAQERVLTWLAQADATPPPCYSRTDRELHLSTEFSTYTWLLEAMLERVGFVVEWTEFHPSGFFAAYQCRR